MKHKLLIAAASLVLTSCGYLDIAHAKPGDGPSNRCGFGAGACEVQVTVTPGTPKCTISVDLPTIYVGKGTPANATTPIMWKLQTSGYSFDQPGGVLFNKTPRPPAGTFSATNQNTPQLVVLLDKNPDSLNKGTWGYSIYVTGPTSCEYDPMVDNN